MTACDAAGRGQLAGLLARLAAGGPPLTAVLHAAGVGEATAVGQATPAGLAGVLAAKAAGAGLLDELTAGLDLDAFVLFSSVSATWAGGRSGYAAANAYLDALAAAAGAGAWPRPRWRGGCGAAAAWAAGKAGRSCAAAGCG